MPSVEADREKMKEYINIQAAPFIFIGNCSLYFNYKLWPGENRYDTIVYENTPPTVTCSVETDEDTYTMNVMEDEIKVKVTVTGGVEGLDNPDMIEKVLLNLMILEDPDDGDEEAISTTYDTPAHEFELIIPRSELETGVNTYTIKGYSTYISKLGKTDRKTTIDSKEITINVEERADPYVNCELTLDRKYVEHTGGDVVLNATIDGELFGIKDIEGIVNSVTYRIKQGEASFVDYSMPVSLSGTKEVSFTITEGEISGSNYEESFTAEVVFDTDDNIIADSDTENIIIAEVPEPTPVPPSNIPPQVIMDAPGTVRAGDDFYVSAEKSDLDGDTVALVWDEGVANGNVSGNSGTLWYSYNYGGTSQNIKVDADDGNGGTDTDIRSVAVSPPEIFGNIQVSGSLKENRKVTISNNGSDSPDHYPINVSNFSIAAISGGTAGDIKYSGSLTGVNAKDILFKKAGTYRITLYLRNTAGYDDTVTKDIVIIEDKPPVADFETITSLLRDPETGYATIEAVDMSYSPDNDIIASRKWKIIYDSDNDGNFNDETKTTFNTGNNLSITLNKDEVGKYKLELEVQEDFGQETISAFVTADDYKKDDTMDKSEEDSVIEIKNIAPVISYTTTPEKLTDIQIIVGDASYSKYDIQSKVNSILIPGLYAEGIDAKVFVTDVDTDAIRPDYIDCYLSGAKVMGYNTITGETYTYADLSDRGSGSRRLFRTPKGDLFVRLLPSHVNDGCAMYFIKREGGYKYIGWGDTHPGFDWGDYFTVKAGIDGCFYWADTATGRLYKYDPETDTKTTISTYWMSACQAIAIDVDGTVYYYTRHGDDFTFLRVRPGENVHKYDTIYDYDTAKWHDIGIGADNKLYLVMEPDGTSYNLSVCTVSSGRWISWTGITSYKSWATPIGDLINEKSVTMESSLKNTVDIMPILRDYSKPYMALWQNSTFDDLAYDDKKSNIIFRALKEKYSIFGVGSSASQSQMIDMINATGGDGLYLSGNNINNVMNGMKDKIIDNFDNTINNFGKYIPVGVPLDINVLYSDYENDAEYSRRYMYTHNPNYFENSNGVIEDNGKFVSEPITQFNKVGKYTIFPQTRDNPKNNNNFDEYRLWSNTEPYDLFVHRLPVVNFKILGSANMGTATKTENFNDSTYIFDFKNVSSWGWGSSSYHSKNHSNNSTGKSELVVSSGSNITIDFDYKTSSEKSFDHLIFYINGVRYLQVSGNYSWKHYSRTLSGGTYTLKWEYKKDGSVSSYNDTVYIDNLQIKSDSTVSYNVSAVSSSFDYDHKSQPNKGILNTVYSYKEAGASDWITGLPSTIALNKYYLFKQSVMDEEFAWSSDVQLLNTVEDVVSNPIAQFEMPATISMYDTLSITDNSYHPFGEAIAAREWEVYDSDGVLVYSGSTMIADFSSYGKDDYRVRLRGFNSKCAIRLV
jgi:hypothetical protein